MTLAQGNGYGRGRRAAALFIRKLQWRLAGPRSFEEKRLVVYEIVKEYEPRMDTNEHEDRWTSFNDKRR